jgi:release factor glutamine methyltransferase
LTLNEVLAAGRARLVAAGITRQEAAVDVDVFARTILGWDKARLLTSHTEPVPEALQPRFSEYLTRRERREPTAYIVGSREFWGLDFHVTPAVLIPRPETELIVETTLALLRDGQQPLVADIGTGSGCLAVSIAHDQPGARVIATDVSEEALDIARQNARRHGVADRVRFVRTSYLDGVDSPFDVIVANPPYVKDSDKPALSREVGHEPDVALFGGRDGLRDIAGVLDAAHARLEAGGWLVFEFGLGQEEHVRGLLRRYPAFECRRVLEDLQGIARTAVVQRRITP